MSIGAGIAVAGIWMSCAIAVASGAEGAIFGGAVLATFMIAVFN